MRNTGLRADLLAVFAAGCVLAATAIAVVAALASNEPHASLAHLLYLPSLFVLLIGGSATCFAFASRGDAFSLGSLVTLFYVLFFGAGSLYYHTPGRLAGSSALVGFQSSYTTAGLELATVIAAAGWLSWIIGYALGPGAQVLRHMPRPRVPASADVASVVVALLVVGWLGRILVLKQGLYFRYGNPGAVETGVASTAVKQLANLPLVAIALVGIERYRPGGRPKIARWYWPLIVLELAWALPSGERAQPIGLAVLAGVVRYYSSPEPFPWRKLVVAAALVILVVLPFGAFYRGPGSENGYQSDPGHQLTAAASQLVAQSPSDAITAGIDETLSRFSDIASLATIATQGRARYPYAASGTFATWVDALVPRVLDPSKANPGTIGNQFGRNYGIVYYTEINTSSIAVSQVGDFFGAFGWLGVTLGLAFSGVLYRGIAHFFYDLRENSLMLAIYAAVVGQLLLRLETSFAIGYFNAIKEAALFTAVAAAVSFFTSSGRARDVQQSVSSGLSNWIDGTGLGAKRGPQR